MPDDEVAEKVILLLRDDFLQRDLAGTKQRKARLCVIWPHLAKRPRHSWERLAEPWCPAQSVLWATNGEKDTDRLEQSAEKYCQVRGIEL